VRKLLFLAAIGTAVWWFVTRRGAPRPGGVTIGYEDGSSVTLEVGSPEHERLLAIAAGAAAP
jgi:hypothetical protein